MAKYLALDANGAKVEVQPVTASAGAADAGKLAQLDSSGKLDPTTMPTGIGQDTQSVLASEALSAGDFINFYDNSGTKNCRRCLGADATKPAHGFVLAAFGASSQATVYVRGLNDKVATTGFTAANVGKKAFMSPTVAGGATPSRPTGSGQLLQFLGNVVGFGSTVTINFSQDDGVVLA